MRNIPINITTETARWNEEMHRADVWMQRALTSEKERDDLRAIASKMANDLFSIRNYAYSNMLGGDAQVMRLIFEKSEAALVAWKSRRLF